MGRVDCLSREPNGGPWLESELNEKFVEKAIESFQLYKPNLKHSRMCSRFQIERNEKHVSLGCYSNQTVQNWTKLDRNEKCFGLRPSKHCYIYFDQSQYQKKDRTEKLTRNSKKSEK